MKIVRVTVATVVLAIMGLAYGWFIYVQAVDVGATAVAVSVGAGDGFGQVAARLQEVGLVRSTTVLKIAARLQNLDRKLTPGRYEFTGAQSCRTIIHKLASADFVRIKVTIPEGSTIWKTASILQEKMKLDSAATVAMNRDSTLLSRLRLPCLEGYLFPETYFFPWGADIEQVVLVMSDAFHAATDSLWSDSMAGRLTREEIVILASIIEAETGLGEERSTVASVYHNRLKRKMKLDADPSVIYGLGGLDRPLYKKDLRKDTPYNTYLHRGLPPSPINSCGLASIKAAISPASTDFLYFVADNSGGHHFSKSNAEHNRAKKRIRETARQGK